MHFFPLAFSTEPPGLVWLTETTPAPTQPGAGGGKPLAELPLYQVLSKLPL